MSAPGLVDESVAALPSAPLRPLIGWYSGYRQAGVPPARHSGMPSPYLTVIFTLHEPLTVAAHPDGLQAAGEYQTLVGGLHTAPAVITHEGRQSGIQVSLSPLGARALLGLPAGELASIDVEGADVLGSLAPQVQVRIREAASWPQRFAVVDDLLRARLAEADTTRVAPEVAAAWRLLMRSHGEATLPALAAETGWSERHLRGRFAAEVGLSPKAAARVIRFDRARRLLLSRVRAGGRPALADLAACCGFYDQAHLDREFRSLGGCAPTTWLDQEFRNVQAPAGELLEA